MNEEDRIKLLSKCNDIDCICQDCIYLNFVKKNILSPIEKDNKELKSQLKYFRDNEYLNQLKFERNLLEDIVQNGGVSNEDKEFLDMTHRNTELLEENQMLKDKIEYLKSKIENKEKWCQLIANLGYDYDGYRDSKNLMLLIDELVKYALYSRDDYNFEVFLREQ